jgi:hypothetical protein
MFFKRFGGYTKGAQKGPGGCPRIGSEKELKMKN